MTRSTTPASLPGRRLPALLLPAVLLLIGGGAIAAMVTTTGTGDSREATVPPGTVFVAALDRTVAWAHVDQTGFALFEEAVQRGVRAAETIADALGARRGESWL